MRQGPSKRSATPAKPRSSILPRGWVLTSLSSLGEWRGGGTPNKGVERFWANGSIPWVSPKDMKRSVIDDAQDKITPEAVSQSATQLIPAGSILIVTRSGILKHTLPVAVTLKEVAINQDIKALTPFAGIDPAFVAWQLRSESRRILEATAKAGTTVDSIAFPLLREFEFKLAPVNEQSRILARLEPLMARCASVRKELSRISQLIPQYRRATLDAAFRGALTHRKVAGHKPAGWKQVPLRSLLVEPPANGISPRAATSGRGTLSLKLTATTSGFMRLDDAAVKLVDISLPPASKYWLKPGDLLVQRANSLEHVGAAAIYEGRRHKYIYPDLMIRGIWQRRLLNI